MLAPSDGQAPLPAGLLLGLSGKAGQDLGLGLLLNRAVGEILEVLSPVAEVDVVQVYRGLLILDEDFAEGIFRQVVEGYPVSPNSHLVWQETRLHPTHLPRDRVRSSVAPAVQ